MKNNLLKQSYLLLVSKINEGVHIIDEKGITCYYNQAMEKIEGLEASDIIGKHILEAYSGWTEENSTLLTVLKTGREIHRSSQSYLNKRGKPISTLNTSMPIYEGDTIIGALEISQNMTDMNNLSKEVIKLRQQLLTPKKSDSPKKHYTFDMLIGRDAKYLNAIKVARRAALTSSSIIIYGETGTGKEIFAQSIHYESDRKNHPFLAVNCAALPETLLESILFGTTKGSFTGAEDRPGLFEQAHNGSLFLDEINSMSLNLQSKLLRVLQEGYIRRIGGLKDIQTDVRIITATNVEPSLLIEAGELRKDLYYRINVLSIHIPSLKDRKGDIKYLIDYFLKYYNEKLKKDVWMLSDDVTKRIEQYDWKGNVRELQNFIESCLNMIQDDHVIKREYLPAHWQESLEMVSHTQQILIEADINRGLNEQVEELEEKIILEQMQRHHYNISRAARALDISRQNLQYKLKKYKIVPR